MFKPFVQTFLTRGRTPAPAKYSLLYRGEASVVVGWVRAEVRKTTLPVFLLSRMTHENTPHGRKLAQPGVGPGTAMRLQGG